ncbi:MAG: hypothetical protein P4M09_21605 [Devosia sp.]|nr:hypothetical protein [Devosia sp.]
MRRRRPPTNLTSVNFGWYAVALVPIAALVVLPLFGWLPVLVLPFALFFLFFWIFSFGFAIYAKLSKRPEPRQ